MHEWRSGPPGRYNPAFFRPGDAAHQRRPATDGMASRREWYSMAKTASATAPAAPKKARILTEEEILKAPEKDYMNEAQLAFFRQRLMDLRDQLLQNADDTGEHLRENEGHHRSVGPRDARGGVHARASHARPRAQAAEEGREVDQADRRRLLRLLRGNRRTHRRAAPAGAPDGDAVAGGAGAPRARPEAVRRLTVAPRGATPPAPRRRRCAATPRGGVGVYVRHGCGNKAPIGP